MQKISALRTKDLRRRDFGALKMDKVEIRMPPKKPTQSR
jgi:hypothetical protein